MNANFSNFSAPKVAPGVNAPTVISIEAPTPVEADPLPTPTPVVSPILALLRSRKFIVGLIGVVFNFLVTKVPDLALYRGELMLTVTGVALSIILGIAYEDGKAMALEAQAGQLVLTPDEFAKDTFGDLIDAVTHNVDGSTQVTLKPNVTVTNVQ